MKKILENIIELIGWIQIMISPILISSFICFIIYYNFQNTLGLVISFIVIVIGLYLGIRLANKKYKSTGTIDFLSRIDSSPELDNKNDENKN